MNAFWVYEGQMYHRMLLSILVPSTVSSRLWILMIFAATSRISMRTSEFWLTPSHLFIFLTSLGIFALFSGTGVASISKLKATNANQTETETKFQYSAFLNPNFWKSKSWEIKVYFKPWKKLSLYYKAEKNLGAKPEKKSRFAGPELFLRFEIGLDFSRPWFSEIKVQIKRRIISVY